jgi:NADH:ubiquinone oxidoreductase subunit 4 (subunit M)
LVSAPASLKTQVLLFVAFFVAFAVKVPMGRHTWLPDAHVEAYRRLGRARGDHA